MSKSHLQTAAHERSYLIGELESLGFSSISLNCVTNQASNNNANQASNNNDLQTLVKATKDSLLLEFDKAHA